MSNEPRVLRRLAEMERSQAWLARQLRVSRQTVFEWVHGNKAPTPARRAQIALTLGGKSSDYFDQLGNPVSGTPMKGTHRA